MEVTFNPLNRIGSFHKSVMLKTNIDDKFRKLLVYGKVIPAPNKLRFRAGNLLLDKRNINFRMVKDTETKTDTLKIQNGTNKKIEIELIKKPEFIEILDYPKSLKSREQGKIIVTTSTQTKKYYGHFIEDLIFSTHIDSFESKSKIKIIISIKEDFSSLTKEELQNSPKIYFDVTKFDLGAILENRTIEFHINFKNNGKKDLFIR